ncbi:bifunctional hydroxymethylpyrimidine kinase/phosphomethylpyrimidine kinase [Gottfriedia acidiceleris]|uniref:bifunctional hydroxymethylpyrimidine kinase/phosphomethylpyrimidine kinase n=1 Tax=Gottfriedia acidiceleris TaxID=371036 RepID=UPI0033948597
MKKVLTIAGSDSSGGAGIQADLKTFSAHRVFGMSVITAVTAQNTQGVFAVQDMTPEMIASQLDAIFTDIEVDAVKIGMVSQIETIKVIAEKLKQYKPKQIVVDPVMVSKSGFDLLSPDAKEALIQELIPLATVITPNLPEAEVITGRKITTIEEMKEAAIQIHSLGAKNVLVKGGHLEGEATDICFNGEEFTSFNSVRINTINTHGTGCTLSSAITSNLANELKLNEAIRDAKNYITLAIQHSFSIGKGVGPVHHFYSLYEKAGAQHV